MSTTPHDGPIRRKLGKLLFNNPLVASSEWALRGRLNWRGAKTPPQAPTKFWNNSTLKSKAQADESVAHALECGLPPHQDGPKNWDALTALKMILDCTKKEDPVMDAGATLYSSLLPWLYQFGYQNLIGMDLVYQETVYRGPIKYMPGDLTKTPFEDGHFGAISCLSVVEHGVPLEAYFKEMFRLIKPGGALFTSTDYWDEGVDTQGKHAYGVPIRIFTKDDLNRFIDLGTKAGFELKGEVDLKCDEKVVNWEGIDFTFASICLHRP